MDWLGVAALCVAAMAGLTLTFRPQTRVAPAVGLVGFWAALGLLAWRFVTVDLRLAEVAELSRDELSWPLRLAGVWAGSAGSFLFWSTVVATVAALAIGARNGPLLADGPDDYSYWPRRILGLTMAVTSLAAIFVAQPFDRLAEPAVRGTGLNPVLEHWAMVVHPPLLYSAQATVLAAALICSHYRPSTTRRWTLAATALLLSATLLGAWWAHDELGWGGFWAWDPVENTALAPLVAMVASLHARSELTALRWRRIAAAAVLAGIAVTRSGLPSSVHAFASGGLIAPLFAVAAAAAAATAITTALPRRAVEGDRKPSHNTWLQAPQPRHTPLTPDTSHTPDTRHMGSEVGSESVNCDGNGRQATVPITIDQGLRVSNGPGEGSGDRFGDRCDGLPRDGFRRRMGGLAPRRVAAAVTAFGAAWILIVVGSAAVAAMWLGTRDPVGAVDGGGLGTLTAPVGAAIVAGLIAYGFRRSQAAAAVFAHVGVLVFALGVIGSLFSTSATSGVLFGEPTTINGHRVLLVATTVDESRTDTVRADVATQVDGRSLTASIVNYPDLDRTRARPGRLVDLTGETELVVTMLDGDKALVELRRNPGLPYVWLGGALIVMALLGSLRRGGYSSPDSVDRRRSRLAASNDPSVELSSDESDGLGTRGVEAGGAGVDVPGFDGGDEPAPVASG